MGIRYLGILSGNSFTGCAGSSYYESSSGSADGGGMPTYNQPSGGGGGPPSRRLEVLSNGSESATTNVSAETTASSKTAASAKTRRIGENKKRRKLQEGAVPPAGFDVSTAVVKAVDGPATLQTAGGGSSSIGFVGTIIVLVSAVLLA